MDKKKSTTNKESCNVCKIMFGHEEINKKDITEALIIVAFTIFLSFMHLKAKNSI